MSERRNCLFFDHFTEEKKTATTYDIDQETLLIKQENDGKL
jgi:hypothetical protein